MSLGKELGPSALVEMTNCLRLIVESSGDLQSAEISDL